MDINKLKIMLLDSNINLEKWSHNHGTKNIEDLKNEIDKGETNLEFRNNQLFRVVKLISIHIQVKLGDKIFTLAEDKQIFFTGAIRKRNLKCIAEKIKYNEKPELTLKRALEEEIGLTIDKKAIFQGETEDIKTSPSYPGLNSIYQIYNYYLLLNHEELGQIRFSEYQKNKGKINLFTLIPSL